MSVKRYNELKSGLESKKLEAAKAAGRKEELMKQLEETFGCTDLKQAEAKMRKLAAAAKKATIAFDKALASFDKEWGDKLS